MESRIVDTQSPRSVSYAERKCAERTNSNGVACQPPFFGQRASSSRRYHPSLICWPNARGLTMPPHSSSQRNGNTSSKTVLSFVCCCCCLFGVSFRIATQPPTIHTTHNIIYCHRAHRLIINQRKLLTRRCFFAVEVEKPAVRWKTRSTMAIECGRTANEWIGEDQGIRVTRPHEIGSNIIAYVLCRFGWRANARGGF